MAVKILQRFGPSTEILDLSSNPELDCEPFVCFRLLDLPPELAQLLFSLIHPGILSNRQFLAVVQHVMDRTTLLPKIVDLQPHEQQALRRRTRAQSRLDLEARRQLSLQSQLEFLKETGCDSYDV